MRTQSLFLIMIMTLLVLIGISCAKKDSPNSPSGSTSVSSESPRSEGTSTNVGSGGNGAEAEWKQIAQEIAENVRVLNTSKIDPKTFDLIKSKFSEVVKKAKVEFKDYPLIYGHETSDIDNPLKEKNSTNIECNGGALNNSNRERDAINFKNSDKIKVNRIRFNCYPKKGLEVVRLVLHEYIGLLGLDEKQGNATNYLITNALITEFKKIHRFEGGLQKIEIESCEQLQGVGQENMPEGDVQMGESAYPYAFRPRKIWFLSKDVDCQNQKIKFRYLTGHLNGNGYTVKNLKISSDENGSFALFKSNCSQCIIANLKVENAIIYGRAILIGENHGKIVNTTVSGKIYVDRSTAGGLAVYNNFGTIDESSSNVNIASKVLGNLIDEIGGLVAGNYQGIISNSHAYVVIENGNDRIGGIAATNVVGEIRLCTSNIDFKVKNSSVVGGIAGLNAGLIAESYSRGKITVFGDGKELEINSKINGIAGEVHDHISEEIKQSIVNYNKQINKFAFDPNDYPAAKVENSTADVVILKN